MSNADTRRCQVVVGRSRRVCNIPDAYPTFTTRLSEVSARNPQPRWVCEKHMPQFPSVGAISGGEKPVYYKSYEVINGEMIPLPREEQYAEVQARKAS